MSLLPIVKNKSTQFLTGSGSHIIWERALYRGIEPPWIKFADYLFNFVTESLYCAAEATLNDCVVYYTVIASSFSCRSPTVIWLRKNGTRRQTTWFSRPAAAEHNWGINGGKDSQKRSGLCLNSKNENHMNTLCGCLFGDNRSIPLRRSRSLLIL